MNQRLLVLAWLVIALVAPAPPAGAQTAGRLLVTVSDPTGGVMPTVTVTVTAQGRQLPPATAATSAEGVATFADLTPGRYTVEAVFQGFETTTVRDVEVRAGDSRRTIVMPLSRLEATVSVATDSQTTAADRTRSFGTSLTPDQVSALADDPDDLRRQIQDIAGADAIFRVDSFEGQSLPPKSQIKSIHVTRDQFAAETAIPGSTFVDIITQPGVGPVRGGATFSFNDASMNAKSQFAATKGDAQARGYSFNIGGALIEQRSNFSISVNGRDDYLYPNLNAALPSGTRADAINLRQPSANLNVNALFDYALTKDQTLRFGYSQSRYSASNLGVGAYDLPERAFSMAQNYGSLRILEAGPIGRRAFINSRANINWSNFENHALIERPTIIVQDAFASGGGQHAGGWTGIGLNLASDFDYIRGIHSWRAGFQTDTWSYQMDTRDNYFGTYTFTSLDAYEAGVPALFTQQVGNPNVSYFNAQTGIYVQDDMRISRNLTLSPGLRYSLQNHVDDKTAFEPRLGVTWTVRNGTALRASAGVFHGWLPLYVYEQTLRLDGNHLRELSIINPTYPDPGSAGDVAPVNKYLLGDFKLQRNIRYSAGIEHTFSPRLRANLLYNYIHLEQQPRGRNLNAPIDGVRPDPAFANVIESVTDAEIRRHEIFVNVNGSLFTPGAAANRALLNWRRVTFAGGFSRIEAVNNSSGPFAVPPSGILANEWGPGPADMPYRVNLSVVSTQVRNLSVNVGLNASDGNPYTWTTGIDDNQDGLLNDRPAGVEPRSLRTPPQSTVNGRISYTFALQRQQTSAPPSSPASPQPPARYRASVYMNVTNITNRANLGGYSGNERSPFFRKATLAVNPRRIDIGVNLNF